MFSYILTIFCSSAVFLVNNSLNLYTWFCKCSVQVKQLQNPETVFETIIGIIIRLAEHGLIHCDFNEFNIMVCLNNLYWLVRFIVKLNTKYFFIMSFLVASASGLKSGFVHCRLTMKKKLPWLIFHKWCLCRTVMQRCKSLFLV
jgi:hypothetical protein